MCDTLYAILNKSENATLQYFIFSEKVLDEKYLLNVLKTSSKRFVETQPICLTFLMSEICSSLCLKLYSLNFAITHAQKDCYAYQNLS